MNYRNSKNNPLIQNPLAMILLASMFFALMGFILIQSNTCVVTGYINSSRGGEPKSSIICKVF